MGNEISKKDKLNENLNILGNKINKNDKFIDPYNENKLKIINSNYIQKRNDIKIQKSLTNLNKYKDNEVNKSISILNYDDNINDSLEFTERVTHQIMSLKINLNVNFLSIYYDKEKEKNKNINFYQINKRFEFIDKSLKINKESKNYNNNIYIQKIKDQEVINIIEIENNNNLNKKIIFEEKNNNFNNPHLNFINQKKEDISRTSSNNSKNIKDYEFTRKNKPQDIFSFGNDNTLNYNSKSFNENKSNKKENCETINEEIETNKHESIKRNLISSENIDDENMDDFLEKVSKNNKKLKNDYFNNDNEPLKNTIIPEKKTKNYKSLIISKNTKSNTYLNKYNKKVNNKNINKVFIDLNNIKSRKQPIKNYQYNDYKPKNNKKNIFDKLIKNSSKESLKHKNKIKSNNNNTYKKQIINSKNIIFNNNTQILQQKELIKFIDKNNKFKKKKNNYFKNDENENKYLYEQKIIENALKSVDSENYNFESSKDSFDYK